MSSSLRSFTRTPLFLIIVAIVVCNVLAYAFFFNFDTALPKTASGSNHFRMQLQLHRMQDQVENLQKQHSLKEVGAQAAGGKQESSSGGGGSGSARGGQAEQERAPTAAGNIAVINSASTFGASSGSQAATTTPSSGTAQTAKGAALALQNIIANRRAAVARERHESEEAEGGAAEEVQAADKGSSAATGKVRVIKPKVPRLGNGVPTVSTQQIAAELGSVINAMTLKKRARIRAIAMGNAYRAAEWVDPKPYPLPEAMNQTDWSVPHQ